MGKHPLSFCEVLEDEYRYFHGDVPYEAIRFEVKQVREIEDLAKRLDFHRSAETRPSRWKVLAKAVKPAGDRTAAVIDGLNGLLEQPGLLDEMLTDDDFADQVLDPAVTRALLHIPVARRLLLANDILGPKLAGDDALVDDFAEHSAAIRVLCPRFRPILAGEPALLSLISDDEVLERELARTPAAAAPLASLFPVEAARPVLGRLRKQKTPTEEELARRREERKTRLTARFLREKLLGGVKETDVPPDEAIPPVALSRFNAVLIELAYADYISDGQVMRAMYAAIHKKETAALCLSGGGIRSATFSLGVLQGMADHRMLNRFHYISTVSGGGYIGSWLSSWIRRHTEGVVGVAKDLSRVPADPLQPEVAPIRHLREYSSYLAPRATAFSLDSWTLVATYIRNLLLNWTMLLPALAAALAIPRLFEAFVITSVARETTAWTGWGSLAAAFVAVVVIGFVRPASELPAKREERTRRRRALFFWLLPLAVSAFLFCTYWASQTRETNIFIDWWWLLPATFAAGSAFGALIFGIRYARESAEDTRDAVWRAAVEFSAAAVSGAFAGWLLVVLFKSLFAPETLTSWLHLEIYICLAVPLYLLVFFAQSTLLIGVTTQEAKDYDREWWARSAAAVFVFCVLHAGSAFAMLLLPVLIFELPELTAPVGGLSGIGAWLLARTMKRGPKEAAPRLMPLLRLAATITVLFVIAAISMVTSLLLESPAQRFENLAPSTLRTFVRPLEVEITATLSDLSVEYVTVLRGTRMATIVAFILAAAARAALMALVLNVNIYSMHGMYRNRLIRAYLGASRWVRTPDPFTGFDPQDNVEMWNLRPHCLWQTSFINFEQFASDLAWKPWWISPKVAKRDAATGADVAWARDLVTEFNVAPPARRKELKDETMAAVVETLNDLMRCYDLEHDAPSPPTLRLLEQNRRYLENAFPTSLKKHEQQPRIDRDVERPERPDTAMLPRDKQLPPELRNASTDDVPLLSVPPLHVVNASLNLVAGGNLAWQERKAASFTITPLHAGSRTLSAYRDTAEYGERITLGTAMAISGAAVSPNMGALSSPAFTFLMTLFNARLGWWIGNPAAKTHDQASPRMSLVSLLREALGKTDASHGYVFLSDGGHFENLGLYEMVLRRCKYIVVCDASADSSFAFGDLANAVRKIRIDLGVPIAPLVTKYIGPQKDERYGRYCALGTIHYDNVDGGNATGYLVYIKPVLHDDCPPDVSNYANESVTFPHETTADQFFSESQFESYRALGRHVIGRICGDQIGRSACVAPNVPIFFAKAWAYVNDATPPAGDVKIETVSDVVGWMRSSLGETVVKPAAPPA